MTEAIDIFFQEVEESFKQQEVCFAKSNSWPMPEILNLEDIPFFKDIVTDKINQDEMGLPEFNPVLATPANEHCRTLMMYLQSIRRLEYEFDYLFETIKDDIVGIALYVTENKRKKPRQLQYISTVKDIATSNNYEKAEVICKLIIKTIQERIEEYYRLEEICQKGKESIDRVIASGSYTKAYAETK